MLIMFFPFFQVSSMGITPFFVENVSELQLCAIKLVTAVSCSQICRVVFIYRHILQLSF